MANIHEIKEREATDTPLLLFDCVLADGTVERWSTHAVTYEGAVYEARVLRHDLMEMRAGSDEGADGASRAALTLGNADSHFSQVERNTGWKGSRLTARFVFFDLKAGAASSESVTLFKGVANAPEEITEAAMRLSFQNRLSAHRVQIPQVRIQRRCPWAFPATAEQREEAVNGGARGRYSAFYRCGYSADSAGGAGNLNGGAPYASCDYTRSQCEERGMFREDSQGRVTRRFGGVEYVPASILVRSHGEKGAHVSTAVENEARYNDFVPVVYGTGWYRPPVVFARNDGNLTRMEVLLGLGPMQGVQKVLVNGVEIPQGQAGQNMTGTGWYTIAGLGERTGAFNPDFADANGAPLGDPYGSMAVLAVAVPSRLSDGQTLPKVEVLAEGLVLPTYDETGAAAGDVFTNNPAWVLLDVLRRSGWEESELDTASFARAAGYCGELIAGSDPLGNPTVLRRFQCNMALRQRRSAADVLRGVKNGSALMLTYGSDGRLGLRVEGGLAVQQPVKGAYSNSEFPLNGGWPVYEFGDGAAGGSGILRREGGDPALRFWSRSTADTANRLSVEFQDEYNEYQQDSLALVDIDDALRTGQEVSAALPALGIPNFHQAGRILRLHLDKSIRGNRYVELETSVKGMGIRPGEIIALTSLKDGLERQAFRVQRATPGRNYETVRLVAQWHEDGWYSDAAGDGLGGRRQPGYEVGLPRPLVGKLVDEDGEIQFGVTEAGTIEADGSGSVVARVEFEVPQRPAIGAPLPLVSLSAQVGTTGGTIAGGQTLYYAVTGIDGDGGESGVSFVVKASVPGITNTNTVTLQGLSFGAGTTAFHVYRGSTPGRMLRIASGAALASEFTDTGLESQLTGPPDGSYDHANFYWRMELHPPVAATSWSGETVGNGSLGMQTNEYRGMLVRLTKGRGAEQERVVIANDATTLTVSPRWSVTPDATTYFAVAEGSWRFGSMARWSPAEFEVPNRRNATVQISGRAANVHDRECAAELSPLTRWRIGGSAGAAIDEDVPEGPQFGLAYAGQGTVEVVSIGFTNLAHTRTVAAATLTLFYWEELGGLPGTLLDGGVTSGAEEITLTQPGSSQAGDLVQVQAEIMRVETVLDGGLRYQVTRGWCSSAAEGHSAGVRIFPLKKKTLVIPFARDFFGSPASGSFGHPVHLPDVRIAGGEMFVTNSQGHSETIRKCFTATTDYGLRTLSGGQLTIQVEGSLAIQSNAAPPLVLEAPHAVRDVFATVKEAPTGGPIVLRLRLDGAEYCQLTIPAGQRYSDAVAGLDLGPLVEGGELSLDVVSVIQTGQDTPGRDLTVTVRL